MVKCLYVCLQNLPSNQIFNNLEIACFYTSAGCRFLSSSIQFFPVLIIAVDFVGTHFYSSEDTQFLLVVFVHPPLSKPDSSSRKPNVNRT